MRRSAGTACLVLVAAAAGIPATPGVHGAQEADTESADPPLASPETPCPPPPAESPLARGVIEGTVRDRRTGLPLPGSLLLLALPGEEHRPGSSLTFRTDDRGRYRLCRLPVGWTVAVRAEHHGVIGAPASIWIPADSAASHDVTIYLGEPGTVTGRVRDRQSGDPVAGATVRVAGLGTGAVTGDDGEFGIPSMPGGDYGIEVEHLAYGVNRDSVTVRSGMAVRLDLRLAPRAVPLEPLTVTVEEERPIWLERTGFYRRRSRESGIFFTREELLEEGHSRLSEVFRGLSGVRIRNGKVVMRRAPRSALSGGRACPLQYFIDGQAVALPGGVDTYLPQDVAAVELYRGPSEVPMAFNRRRAACGALVLWLRSRRD